MCDTTLSAQAQVSWIGLQTHTGLVCGGHRRRLQDASPAARARATRVSSAAPMCRLASHSSNSASGNEYGVLIYRISPSKIDIPITAPNRSPTRNGKATRKRHAKESLATGHRSLYTGLIRLHVLHHAVEESVYGFAMIEELRRHGYELSSGTLYPILHGLEKRGLLTSARKRYGGTERRVYCATAAGRKALTAAKSKVRELFGELFENEERGGS